MSIKKFIFYLSVLSVISILFLSPQLIRISTVNCRSQFGQCGKVLTDKMNSVKKESLYKTKKNIVMLLKDEFLVKDYQVYFKIPGILDVDVIEKVPKFVVISSDGQKKALVDKEGLVLTGTDRTDLPGVITDGDVTEKGKMVGRKELFAMNIMYDIFSLYQVKTGKLESDSLVIELPDDLRVIFPIDGDRQELVGEFMLLYNDIERKQSQNAEDTGKTVREIDLRFKNPILR